MYKLGNKSKRELKGVHPDLVAVVEHAIEITERDFSVHDGRRTEDEQAEYVRTGVSRTMNSMHLKQDDGYGHAVDLVPYINGRLRWEWPPIFKIVEAVRTAALELGVEIVWGGCWQPITHTTADPKALMTRYIAKRREQGKTPFADGPHFQLKG